MTVCLYLLRVLTPFNETIRNFNKAILTTLRIEISFVQKSAVFAHLDHLYKEYFTFCTFFDVYNRRLSSNILRLPCYLLMDILDDAIETIDIPSGGLFYLSATYLWSYFVFDFPILLRLRSLFKLNLDFFVYLTEISWLKFIKSFCLIILKLYLNIWVILKKEWLKNCSKLWTFSWYFIK